MALTYALINKITVGSGGAANIEFTSIPQTYTDLICHFSLREGTSTGVSIQFNSSSATYANQRLYSSGSSITADTFSTSDIVPNSGVDSTYTSNVFGNGMIYIPSYTTAEQKAVIAHGSAENNASSPAFLMRKMGYR
jgi:hypothetical protein